MQWMCNICSEEHRGKKGLFLAPDPVFTSRIIPLETVDLHAYKPVERHLEGVCGLPSLLNFLLKGIWLCEGLWTCDWDKQLHLDSFLMNLCRTLPVSVIQLLLFFVTWLVKRYFCGVHCSKWTHFSINTEMWDREFCSAIASSNHSRLY